MSKKNGNGKTKLSGLPAVKIGQAVVFTGKGGAPTGKPWLKPGARLVAAANVWSVFHGNPLLHCKTTRNGKEVRFYLAPKNVAVAK